MTTLKGRVEYHVIKGTDVKLVSFSFDEADKKVKALKRKSDDVRLEARLIIYKEAE